MRGAVTIGASGRQDTQRSHAKRTNRTRKCGGARLDDGGQWLQQQLRRQLGKQLRREYRQRRKLLFERRGLWRRRGRGLDRIVILPDGERGLGLVVGWCGLLVRVGRGGTPRDRNVDRQLQQDLCRQHNDNR